MSSSKGHFPQRIIPAKDTPALLRSMDAPALPPPARLPPLPLRPKDSDGKTSHSKHGLCPQPNPASHDSGNRTARQGSNPPPHPGSLRMRFSRDFPENPCRFPSRNGTMTHTTSGCGSHAGWAGAGRTERFRKGGRHDIRLSYTRGCPDGCRVFWGNRARGGRSRAALPDRHRNGGHEGTGIS